MVAVEPETIRTLSGDGQDVCGDIADVYWLGDATPAELVAAAETTLASATAATAATAVFVAAEATGYIAESFSPDGSPIRFCGHGSLAAAWYVFERIDPQAAELEFSSSTHTWHARGPGNDVISLIYRAPVIRTCAIPDFADACIGVIPLKAAEAGQDDDYLVLELADAAAVQDLEPNAAAIGQNTRRALIVTARASDTLGIVFRYFAPQYGEPEGAVSGSAAVQLAAYWAPRFGAERFTARQLSPGGAIMQLSCHADTVELTGRVGYG